jgi:hypothetical protein
VGGAGLSFGGIGGNATAKSTATSAALAHVSARATATGGAGSSANSGQASAQSMAQNATGAVTTMANSPAGANASAMTMADIGAVAPALVPVSAGQTVSNATLTPGGSTVRFGAMSVGYGGSGQPLTYDAEADFNFATTSPEKLFLTLFSNEASGSGFDSLELKIVVDGNSSFTFQTESLDSAEAFFSDNSLLLGVLGAGNQTVDVSYLLTASAVGDGFGFDFGVGGAVPEPSTWAMMLLGFAGLGYAG